MRREHLEQVLRMAAIELDEVGERHDGTYAELLEAYEAVKAFWGNPRSTWMVPAARGVDAVREGE